MVINKIYNENCLDTMSKMSDNFIDLTVTSPPYDNLRKYNGYEFDFKPIANELYRVTKQGGVVVWVVGDATINGSETGTSFKQALYFKEIGFSLHDTMIYYRLSGPLNHNRYEQEFEYMFVFSKGKLKTFNPIMIDSVWYNKDSNRTGQRRSPHKEDGCKMKGDKERKNVKPQKIKGNVWKMNNSSQCGERFEHPAIFPERLAHGHIISWSNKGDLIYDPFMGSGTTAKMAIMNQRDYVGSEISAEYCKIAEERINNIHPMFDFG